MASLAPSGRLQNAIKYRTKVRKTGAAGKEWNTSATVQHIYSITTFYTEIHSDLVNSQTGYDVISYFVSAFLEV